MIELRVKNSSLDVSRPKKRRHQNITNKKIKSSKAQKKRKITNQSKRSKSAVVTNKRRRKKNNAHHPKKKTLQKRKKALKHWKKLLLELFLSIILGLTLVTLVFSFFIKITEVKGSSMVPTLRAQDVVVIEKRKKIKRFDLLAFYDGKKRIQVRRVIGLPGEKISYKEDTLLINDQPLDEKFIIAEINESQKNGKNYTEDFSSQVWSSDGTIPEGTYFVLGDYRPYAVDSRDYGFVAEKNFLGKATMRVWPLNGLTAF